MKALIVDDEKHVREAIKLLGNWDTFDITELYEANNGEEAIRLIEEIRPEIVFSDMKMPKMDGTKLLEWIKDNHAPIKTIVVTGYEDYHYMRKAIHFGSTDYLLKPVDPEGLNQTIQRAIEQWKQEEAERVRKVNTYQLINKMKPAYRDRKLTQLLTNDGIGEVKLEEFPFPDTTFYTVGVVHVNDQVIKRFQGNRDLAYFTLLNIMNEMVSEQEQGIGFRYLANKGEIILIVWREWEEAVSIVQAIYEKLKESLSLTCYIALGKSVNTKEKLLESYKEAKEIWMSQNVLDQPIEKIYLKKSQQTERKNVMAYEESIKMAVQAGELSAFEELIQTIKSDYTKDGKELSLKHLLQFENEYLVISNRWYKSFNISIKTTNKVEERVFPFFDQNGIFRLESYHKRIKREISVFLKRIKRKHCNKSMNVMEEIEKYLQENYSRDIKLQEISDQFYISREYISRKFKQRFHVNISEYIINIRMEKAKVLLKTSSLKVYEIATMIGYQDDKYFRKVFKKMVGVTPNEFREESIL